MSRNYRFHNPHAPYFVSFAVVEWLDGSTGSPQVSLQEMELKTLIHLPFE